MPTGVDPDHELVTALRQREPTAAETLLTAYGDRAYRLAVRIAGNQHDASESYHERFGRGAAMKYDAWVAKAAKQPIVLETVDFGPLGADEVEVAVEHCGLCHSDLSLLHDAWGISQYPAILGHEVVGRVTTLGPNAKGRAVGQRVGIGWHSGNCMHCRQCMSGRHHLCRRVQLTIVGHRGGFASHIRSHWAWAIPLPEKLDFADAGPLRCGGVTVFAPLMMYFIFAVPEADAIVNAGCRDQKVTLPKMETLVGGEVLAAPAVDARGELTVPMRYLHGAIDPMGHSRLTVRFE